MIPGCNSGKKLILGKKKVATRIPIFLYQGLSILYTLDTKTLSLLLKYSFIISPCPKEERRP
jgi:hypothetical protein